VIILSAEKDELIVEYEVNSDDIELVKEDISKRMPIVLISRIFLVVVIILWEILLILYHSIDGFTNPEIIWVVCSPLINIFVAFVLPWLLSKIIKLDKLIPKPNNPFPKVKVIFNRDGFQSNFGLTSYDLKWIYFTKIIELEHFVFFYLPEHNQLNIPKRVFSDEQIEQLREMLTSYIDPKLTKLKLKKIKKGEK